MKTLEDTHATPQIISIPREEIRPSPLNPRKHFDEEKLNELGLNIRHNGQINPLLVRPAAPTAEHPAARFEIISGECRWRSTGERPHPFEAGTLMPAHTHLDVMVVEIGDSVALTLMISENMKRKDLTPLEEMDAFVRMLNQKDAEGAPLYANHAALAEKIGVSRFTVGDRISLKKLSPVGRAALASETINFFVARAICAAPESVVPLIEDEVLNPTKYGYLGESGATLTAEETEEVIQEKYVRQLRGAPFDPQRMDLVPETRNEAGERVEGGACTSCPWNVANRREDVAPKKGRGRVAGDGHACLNVGCFKKKVEVNISTAVMKAQEEGCKVLTAEDAKLALGHQSPYVRLEEKPDLTDASKSIDDRDLPKWKTIIEGPVKPPVVVAVDEHTGKVHRLVDRQLAITAAQENGTEKYLSLSAGRGRSKQGADVDAQKKKDAEAAKLRGAQQFAILDALVAEHEEHACDLGDTFAAALLPLAARHAGLLGCHMVMKRRKITFPGKDANGGAPDLAETLIALGKKMTGSEITGLVFELLLAEGFALCGVRWTEDLYPAQVKPLLKLYEVDAAAIAKRVKQEKRGAGSREQGGESAAPKKPAKADPAKVPESPRATGVPMVAEEWDDLDEEERELVRCKYRGEADAVLELYLYQFDSGDGSVFGRKELPPSSPKTPVPLEKDEATNPAEDHLLPRARELYASGECRTVPSLQNALKIGYQRALRLFDTVFDEETAADAPPPEVTTKDTKPTKRGKKGGSK